MRILQRDKERVEAEIRRWVGDFKRRSHDVGDGDKGWGGKVEIV